MLIGSDSTASHFPGGKGCVLEWVSRKFNTVTRSSFAAELRNQLEAAHAAIYFAAALQETLVENITTTKLTRIIDTGRLSLPIYLAGDNKGVFTSVSAENPISQGRAYSHTSREGTPRACGQMHSSHCMGRQQRHGSISSHKRKDKTK